MSRAPSPLVVVGALGGAALLGLLVYKASSAKASPAPAAPPGPVVKGDKIVLVGDELVGGAQPVAGGTGSVINSPVALSGELLKLATPAGVHLQTASIADAGIDRFDPSGRRIPSDLKAIVLELGTHALGDPALVRSVVQKLVDGGKRRVVWLVPPALVLRKQPAIEEAIRASGAEVLLPPHTGDGETLAVLTSDGTRPTDQGNKVWADYLWTYLTTGQRKTYPPRTMQRAAAAAAA